VLLAATAVFRDIRGEKSTQLPGTADVASAVRPTPEPGEGDRTRHAVPLAFAVHIFTATGAALGFFAMLAAVRGDWVAMFLWLGVALFVDGIDGSLARKFQTMTLAPRWSGEALDLVVDFVTYVFVPAYAIAASGLMPPWLSVPLCVLILMTSALYFCDREMKTDDNGFRGFPALWNAAAFYLLLLRPPAWAAAAGIVVLAALTFAPIRFVHPFRVARLRILTITVLGVWALLGAIALAQDLSPGAAISVALVACAAYFFLVGLRIRA
jgi:phosphatidylcholine synthase